MDPSESLRVPLDFESQVSRGLGEEATFHPLFPDTVHEQRQQNADDNDEAFCQHSFPRSRLRTGRSASDVRRLTARRSDYCAADLVAVGYEPHSRYPGMTLANSDGRRRLSGCRSGIPVLRYSALAGGTLLQNMFAAAFQAPPRSSQDMR